MDSICSDMKNATKRSKSSTKKKSQKGTNFFAYLFLFKMDLTDIKTEKEASNLTIGALFETLAPCSSQFIKTQCVTRNYEILICGGYFKRDCYSYHTLKDQYKYVCSYPSSVQLDGHCVIKCINNANDNANELILLSFGGQSNGQKKHTLIMKYVSVWDNDNVDNGNTSTNNDTVKHINEWVPLIDKDNNSIIIGINEEDYRGVRGIIGGNNNNLLFITYYPKNIEIFNLDTLQCIKKDVLPIVSGNWIRHHCFILIKDNTNKNNKMLLFCKNIGLSINYNEDNNTFQFDDLYVCSTIRLFNEYAYVYVNDVILFFDGNSGSFIDVPKAVHKYSIAENKWMKFDYDLIISLKGCMGILSEDRNYIYIFGGKNG
ncbi:hypothetical protein RFI_16769 [Reticulomyxa filosa]|uniref:Uncharacterized protein n=1 Tax=Reticulomyxa filosa TaxID=46433 RepID=X6N3J2_RETFI|nr:hypothetical protein RFI_16769 [Reticulomyxa filosa]|eukprot:ETO20448.1 hypothetical protein RFI_16769 [Reticulomyxa filosa]